MSGIGEQSQKHGPERRNRRQMVAILLVALLTLGGSYLLFFYAQSAGWGTINHGRFVEPAVTTEQLGWEVAGERRKWWIWMVAQTCEAACQQSVQQMRALHVLLNREADRVRRGMTLTGPQPGWMAAYPAVSPVTLAQASRVEEGIYIVDPIGNLVLHYPLDTDPQWVLNDLKRLLKVSRIG